MSINKKGNEEVVETEDQDKRISIDWGRQGGVILGYLEAPNPVVPNNLYTGSINQNILKLLITL
jgi:hypothetical protein